jgi:hypothetical protein
MSSRRWVAIALMLTMGATGVQAAAAGKSGLAIEIHDGQLLTVIGQSGSLRALVADICTQAGVKLRGYDAADRPITVSYVDVPLRDALQRLLRDETYMIGVRAHPQSDDVDVAWVHVTGSKGGGSSPGMALPMPPAMAAAAQAAQASAAGVPSSMADFGFPANLLSQALSSQDVAARREATRLLAEHVEANPGLLDSFFAKDMAATAEDLVQFPFAKEALQTLAIRQKDPVARAKFEAMIKTVTLRTGEPSKKPTFSDLMQQGMQH